MIGSYLWHTLQRHVHLGLGGAPLAPAHVCCTSHNLCMDIFVYNAA